MVEIIIIGPVVRDEAEVGRQGGKGAEILRQRNQNVPIVLVDPCQRRNQAADVSPEPEITNPARVNNDFERHFLNAPSRPGA